MFGVSLLKKKSWWSSFSFSKLGEGEAFLNFLFLPHYFILELNIELGKDVER
jgi:hypothetical protein